MRSPADATRKKLNYGGMAFEQLFSLIKTGIQQLSKIQPDLDPLLSQLQAVGEIFKKYSPADDEDDDEAAGRKETITDANALWSAIEPVLYLHDRISKYLQEGLEDTEESTKDYSSPHGQLGEYTNQLVFKYLAIMIESSVRELRNAVKAARDKVDEEAAKADSAQVYLDGTASDPSHSDLSKDHFSNVLNQPAGLVATVTTNWTVQQIVQCWDDPRRDEVRCIDEILTVFHHPCFPVEKTPIQKYMFDTVQKWWEAHTPEDKDRIRAKLTRGAVQRRQHEDHTLTLKDFEGKQSGPAGFPGAWPKVRQPPQKASIVAEWANDAIADFNWALGIVQTGRRDPVDAARAVWGARGSLVHNSVLVVVALLYTIAHAVMWMMSKLLWPFTGGRGNGS